MDHAKGEESVVILCWKGGSVGLREKAGGSQIYRRVVGWGSISRSLTFSSYSSPRNTSGAIQYGEPTTAKGSFLAPSLQRQGGQISSSDISPKLKGMRQASSPSTENTSAAGVGSLMHRAPLGGLG